MFEKQRYFLKINVGTYFSKGEPGWVNLENSVFWYAKKTKQKNAIEFSIVGMFCTSCAKT